jgi:hypothetical protein
MKFAGAVGANALFADRVRFPGEAAYTAGGPTGFQAGFSALMLSNRTILGVISLKNGDFKVEYDHDLDKLKIIVPSTGAEASGDLHLTTFEVLVIST